MQTFLQRQPTEFFKRLLSFSNSAIVITDFHEHDHPIVYVNPAFEGITGYSADELVGHNCRLLQGLERHQSCVDALRKAIAEGTSHECVLRNYRKDGRLFWNHLYLYPIRGADTDITHYAGILHDVTDAVTSRAGLEEKEMVIDHSLDLYLRVGRNGIILEANGAAQKAFSHGGSTITGLSLYRMVPAMRIEETHSDITLQLSHRKPRYVVRDYQHQDGRTMTVEWSLTTAANGDDVIFLGRDITERLRIENEVKHAHDRIRDILNSINEGCFSVDYFWRFTFINQHGAAMLSRHADELQGKNLWEEFPDSVDTAFHRAYFSAMESNVITRCVEYYAPVGKWIEARAYPSPEGLTVFFLDVSAEKLREQRLVHAATHDGLTDLPNRTSCIQHLNQKISECAHNRQSLSVLFIDLDRFKEVNDAYGHQGGDIVLRKIGERLAGFCTPQRFAARMSGDEFVYVLAGHNGGAAELFASQLMAAIRQSVFLNGDEVAIGASIGIAVADGKQLMADDLLNRADNAMYAAKRAGRHVVRMYNSDIEAWNTKRLQLRHEMRSALHLGQFLLHYQPIVSTGAAPHTVSAEALVRWAHPEFGLLRPDAFLPIAEDSYLIVELGEWLINEVCRQCAEWRAIGIHLQIALNLSARQIGEPSLPAFVADAVTRHGLPCDAIKLEVTESMFAQNADLAVGVLADLRRRGFSIALDDFGVGYSNFARLHEYPVDVIKIDRSFIESLDRHPEAQKVLAAVVALGKSLNFRVICEGIETAWQLEKVLETGCDAMQGFHIGRPTATSEFLQQVKMLSA